MNVHKNNILRRDLRAGRVIVLFRAAARGVNSVTDLALIDTTLAPMATFSLQKIGPYEGWSQTGGLLARSTTSI